MRVYASIAIIASQLAYAAIDLSHPHKSVAPRKINFGKIPPPGYIHGLVHQSKEEMAIKHGSNANKAKTVYQVAKEQSKANANKTKIPFADDIIDASQMTPEEIKKQRTLELKMKFDNEEGAKLRAQAKNLTRDIRKSQGICLKCTGAMCPYFEGYCSQMCGMPCTR
eukprot:gnl/MRDRNA2_/MRDRNA2_86878_c0_seq1.p1 gnl/MRDRNA2_/MRDRNA2_86878_c0~~gnl/MRDRNA2_/MRDRNA2_86878_c0_seq1.p1  ORF type:complete len:167 (+),score=41.43 gnl/MRDRNA2_/MRDRNA2_86878_c0_seq1:69-569(+)